ncbi:MAG: 5-formyltetrahydrofolate cyclo-ligase [Candidatus Micrarchaeota archaeon]
MVKHLKDTIRKQIIAKRNLLSNEEIGNLSASISERLINYPEFKKAKVVAFYIPKGNEVDTRKMIEHAITEGKEVLIPVTDHKITFYKFKSFNDLIKGSFGVLEPESRETPSKEPDVVIVPGVTFGLCMHRLGYGKGYYDLYLAGSSAYRIGICFNFQVVEKLPTHEHDQKMDCMITESRVIYPSKQNQ